MQRSTALLLCVLCGLPSGCGGSDFSTKAGTGGRTSVATGGRFAGGGQSARGGAGNTGNTGDAGGTNGTTTTQPVDCQVAWQSYMSDLDAARQCDIALSVEACRADWTLPGPCGCSVLVNAQSDAYDHAKAEYEAFLDTGCDIAACELACPTRSSAQIVPTCRPAVLGATDGVTTCQW